jgi:hypothetical protein
LKEKRIPWPGPRPYQEAEWRLFRGRGSELRRIVSALGAHRLSLLLGATGSGKTSLVQAGVIPELRLGRYHERGDQRQWPALLLRHWGAEGAGSIWEVLYRQIEAAIGAVEAWGRREGHERALEDAEFLREVLKGSEKAGHGSKPIVEILDSLANALGYRERRRSLESPETGIVLVFDQFEELLRGEGSVASESLQLIRDLYLSTEPFRMLIVLRREFVYTLRELEQAIGGGLAGRSMVLGPMPQRTVVEVVTGVSREAGITVDSEVAERIVKLLDKRGAILPSRSGQEKAVEGPDLLHLQAVLRELTAFAFERGSDGISKEVLRDFEALCEDDFLGGALKRWIEAAVKSDVDSADGKKDRGARGMFLPSGHSIQMSSRDVEGQVRRIAIRIGPHMSSLDYKVIQEESTLFRASMGEEIAKLGVRERGLLDLIWIRDTDPPTRNTDEIGLSSEVARGNAWRMSGIAKRKEWNPAQTADQLVLCFRETLYQLARANILTATLRVQGGRQLRTWELVHDQLGPSFTSWARDHRDTWDDCLSSLVVSQGIEISVLVPEICPQDGNDRLDLSALSWHGCTIGPVRSERLAFRDVWFVKCSLVGTIFEACDFYGGGFESCIMDGVLFRNCTFRAGKHGAGPVWNRSVGAGLAIANSSVDVLEVKDCTLRQLTLEGTVLEPGIEFTGDRESSKASSTSLQDPAASRP